MDHCKKHQEELKARIYNCYNHSNDNIQKSEEDQLEKGGEGSKGGKVIGHTKSGKPIYADAGRGYNGSNTFNRIHDHVGSTIKHKDFARMADQHDIKDSEGKTIAHSGHKHQFKANELAKHVPNHGDKKEITVHGKHYGADTKSGWGDHTHKATIHNDNGKVKVTINSSDHPSTKNED